MTQGPGTAAIVVAGGSGERFGREGGKQLAQVGGLPVLSWALRALDRSPGVGLIVVVCPVERTAEYRSTAVELAELETPVVYAASGPSRQASVRSGLAAVPEDVSVVLVHDGARPLLTPETVTEVLAALEDPAVDGAVVGHPSYDTLKLVDGRDVVETPERSRYWAVQTPQAFRLPVLVAAHDRAEAEAFVGTDDASLVEHDSGRVIVVEGPRDNVKVTVPEDLSYVAAVLNHRGEGADPCA